MHIHFHTLKRQWGAHTLAAVSPICSPPHTNMRAHTLTHPKRWMRVSLCRGCRWKSTPCHIYLHKSRRCMRVCLYTYWLCVPGLCACVFAFLCVRVYISSFTSAEEKRPLLLSCCIKKMENNNNDNKRLGNIDFAWFLNVMHIKILQHVLRVSNKQFKSIECLRSLQVAASSR